MKNRTVLLMLAYVGILNGQTETPPVIQWQQSFGGSGDDRFNIVKQTSDGGYVLGGYSTSPVSGNKASAGFGSADYWVVKVDANGNMEWDKAFGGSGYDELRSLQQTDDGGYILGGLSNSSVSSNKISVSFGDYDYWLVKVDANGNKQWEQSFGGSGADWLSSVQQTRDSGYILGGFSNSGVSGNKASAGFGGDDYWIVKVDADGNKQWERSFGGNRQFGVDFDYLTRVQQTRDGGYILGGFSNSEISGNKTSPGFGGFDYWIVKVDAAGDKQWEQSFGGTGDDVLYSLQLTTDGGYILGGYSGSDVSGNKTSSLFGGYDYWVVKVDTAGNKQWERSFGGTGHDILYSLQQTVDGGFILGGRSDPSVSGSKTSASFGGSDFWIVKTDASGSKQWEQSFGGNSEDRLQSLQQTSDGGYILGGRSRSVVSGNKTSAYFGSDDYWLVKLGIADPPRFNSFSLGSNHIFQAQLSGLTGTNYILQASTNLIDWTLLFTSNAANGFVNFYDTSATNFPTRFFRALQQP